VTRKLSGVFVPFSLAYSFVGVLVRENDGSNIELRERGSANSTHDKQLPLHFARVSLERISGEQVLSEQS
jgi:hypothetical protein